MKPRWDIDERGVGVADGRWLRPGAGELHDALERSGWVAEEPEAHLLPDLRRHCDRPDSRLELINAESDSEGTFVVDLRWRDGDTRPHEVRRAVFALIGEIAESATYIRQRAPGGLDVDAPSSEQVTFEVATGMLEGDTRFEPHGHTLLLRVGLSEA